MPEDQEQKMEVSIMPEEDGWVSCEEWADNWINQGITEPKREQDDQEQKMERNKASGTLFQEEKDGKWYFWDEIGYYKYGPHDTQEEAQSALDKYCREVLGL